MDSLASQLLVLSLNIARFSQDRLPTLGRPKEGVIISEVGFGDSGIRKSMSGKMQSSIVSEDKGFINQSLIPGRSDLLNET